MADYERFDRACGLIVVIVVIVVLPLGIWLGAKADRRRLDAIHAEGRAAARAGASAEANPYAHWNNLRGDPQAWMAGWTAERIEIRGDRP